MLRFLLISIVMFGVYFIAAQFTTGGSAEIACILLWCLMLGYAVPEPKPKVHD